MFIFENVCECAYIPSKCVPNTVYTHEKHSTHTYKHIRTTAFHPKKINRFRQNAMRMVGKGEMENDLSLSCSLFEHSAFIEEWTTKITKNSRKWNITYSMRERRESVRGRSPSSTGKGCSEKEQEGMSCGNERLCGKKSKHTKKIWDAMHFSHVLQSRTIQHGITKPEKTDTKTYEHTQHNTSTPANASCLAVYMPWSAFVWSKMAKKEEESSIIL